jgi:ligand-binding sensor domain-containing protein
VDPRVTGWFKPLRVDRRGRMWVARPDGALLIYADGVFRVALDRRRGGVRYTDLYEDGAGALWVGADSADQRSIRRLDGERPVPGTWPSAVPDSAVTSVVPDTADGMWVGTRAQGLWHLTPRRRAGTTCRGSPANAVVRSR